VLPSIKNESVLYYLLYFTSYGLYYAVHNGLTFQYFWPNSPALANKSLVFFLSLSLFFGIQFSRHFLNIKSFSTILDKFNYILALACLVFFVLTPFAGYQALIFPLSALTFLIIVNFMFIGIVALSKGVDSAFFYLLGWGALLVGVIAYMLKSFGVLPHNMWTQNGQQIGSLIEMVILSYALSRKISELQRDIYIDSLTGLSNRRYFDECLIKEFDEAITMAKGACSLLVIDIDNFKKFNDQYGHKMGDKALQSVGAILKKITRKYYIPCRYGGEEFSIILQNTSAEVANVIAERVRKNIECDKSFPYELSVSIGVATLLDKNFVDPQQFFEAADNAMYLAKNNGRNCVENYQAGLLRAATSC
jgi:diguanylate cyclase (GGDEF)-like protein